MPADRGTPERRPSATVVVVAPAGPWPAADAVLDAVRSSLGVHDDVLVAGAPSLARHPGCRPLAAPAGDAVAALVAAADLPTADVVVLVDGATIVTDRWLDALVGSLSGAGDGAVAAGPASNLGTGVQAVADPGYRAGHGAGLRRAARARRAAAPPAGSAVEVSALDPGCLVVRADALAAAAPLLVAGATHADLLDALRVAGPFVVAAGAYVHRCAEPGGDDWVAGRSAGLRATRASGTLPSAGAPARAGAALVSACMIVKDEEEDLPGCLESIRGLVDEVVVYDTGSTDGTVALARAAGATVIEGHWDDDFGRARNAALAACSGAWALHVDADERLTGDHEALRRLLATSDADGFALEIANQDGDGRVVSRHRAVRLFRRERAWWVGRLHEQVTHRPGQPALVVGPTAVMGIDHHGYAAAALESRDKRNRNVRLAEAALGDGDGGDRPRRLLDLARALTAARRHDEALLRFEEARATATSPIVRRTVLWQGAELLLVVGRPAEALRWVDELRAVSDRDDVASFLEAVARLMLGDAGGSLSALDGVQDLWAEDGNFALSADLVAHQRAAALLAAERWEEAADALDSLLAERPHLPLWGSWVRAAWRAGRPVGDVADAVPDAELRGALTQVLLVEDEVADAVGEHLWGRRAGDARLVGFAAHLGTRLPAARALEWSARVRAAGLADHCPLIARAGRAGVAPAERVRSAALAAGAFGDPRATVAVAQAAPHVPEGDLVATLAELGELAPALLPAFVSSAAAVPTRRQALADALDQLGASEQADVLRSSAPGA